MTRIPRRLALCLLLFLTAACGGEEAPVDEAGEEVRTGYRPDTMAWFQEGLPVNFDGRGWQPVGRPVHEAAATFRRVGDFDGMALYAHKEKAPPYEHLFFPYGNDVWQALAPIPDSAAADADTAATAP